MLLRSRENGEKLAETGRLARLMFFATNPFTPAQFKVDRVVSSSRVDDRRKQPELTEVRQSRVSYITGGPRSAAALSDQEFGVS